MQLDLRVEQVGEEHIGPYTELSRSEYGEEAAVSQAEHLRWKYLQNPQGRSVGIHLYREAQLVGRMVALPRRFLYEGRAFTAAHIVDFLVHPSVRGMHALMQLVLGLKQLSGFDFLLIMAPNAAGAAVWEKFVKMPGPFELNTAVVPLQPAAVLQSTGKLRMGKIGILVDWPTQLVVSGMAHIGASLTDVELGTEWPSPAELDQLAYRDWGERIVGYRAAEYLNWRYCSSPTFRYRVLFLRERGDLKGYLVTRRALYEGLHCLFVVDAFGAPDTRGEYWRSAFLKALSGEKRHGLQMVVLLGNTEWGPLASLSGLPFVHVPRRFLPRKATVFAQWIGDPGFAIRSDNFYCALGDGDVI